MLHVISYVVVMANIHMYSTARHHALHKQPARGDPLPENSVCMHRVRVRMTFMKVDIWTSGLAALHIIQSLEGMEHLYWNVMKPSPNAVIHTAAYSNLDDS